MTVAIRDMGNSNDAIGYVLRDGVDLRPQSAHAQDAHASAECRETKEQLYGCSRMMSLRTKNNLLRPIVI